MVGGKQKNQNFAGICQHDGPNHIDKSVAANSSIFERLYGGFTFENEEMYNTYTLHKPKLQHDEGVQKFDVSLKISN